MRKLVSLLVAAILLSACGPSPAQIEAAIAQTQTAAPTLTYTFIPSPTKTETPTPSPTSTLTLTPTATSTNTPTPTPTTDVRVISNDPEKFLLNASEMPEDGKYYIPGSDWMSINTNEEVISGRGVEEGRDYVISTGRITGWWVEFLRGSRAVQMPKNVYILVAKYRTAQGAQLALTKFNDAETNTKNGFKYKTIDKGLGDKYLATISEKITSGGDKQIYYMFEFTYRNYLVQIGLIDLEKYVSHDFALLIGKKVLNKLEAAPLDYPPTATPTP